MVRTAICFMAACVVGCSGGMDREASDAPASTRHRLARTRPASTPSRQSRVVLPAVSAPREGDRLECRLEGRAAIIDVRSRRGIGGGTIVLPDEDGPQKIILRVHLRGLESLRISNDNIEISASVLSHGDNRILQRTRRLAPGAGKAEALKKVDPRRLTIEIVDRAAKAGRKIPVQDGYFQITLPTALLEDLGKTIRLHWIDFYR